MSSSISQGGLLVPSAPIIQVSCPPETYDGIQAMHVYVSCTALPDTI